MRVTLSPLLTLVLFLASASGCPGGTGSGTQLCTPGATQGCVCFSGQQGAQVCGQDGNSWSACQCGGGGLDQGFYYPSDGSVVGDQGSSLPPPPGDQGSSLPPQGNGTCTDIFSCFYASQCQQNDNACFNTCIAKGTQVAQQQYNAVLQCETSAMQGTCSQCNGQPSESCSSCLNQTCGQPYQACGFSFSCAQAYQCLGQCQQNDNACFGGCLGKLTVMGLFRYDKMISCFDGALKGSCQGQCGDPNSQGCYSCVDQACLNEIKACGLTI